MELEKLVLMFVWKNKYLRIFRENKLKKKYEGGLFLLGIKI